MTPLQSWLMRPRTTVRIAPTVRWAAWMKMLRSPFSGGKTDLGPRIEVLDRISLGGKKSLLLISIAQRGLLVGVGEGGAPSIVGLELPRSFANPTLKSSSRKPVPRARKKVRR